jgi:protein-tyrosine phosphatase
MEMTFLPLGLPGNIYRSPMPFGQYDLHGLVYPLFWRNGINAVVLLVPDAECWTCAGQDLRRRYERDGLTVIHLPMKDYRGAEYPKLRAAIDETLRLAKEGNNIDIHCHAGLGRTGLFVACLAIRQLKLNADDAIEWIRDLVPGSIESDEQEKVIREFELADVSHR